MKNLNKSLRRGLLSFALVISLIFGISASPAFAAHQSDASSGNSIAGQEEAAGGDSCNNGQDDQNGEGDGTSADAGDDNGENGGETETDDSDDANENETFLDKVAEIPEKFAGEIMELFSNAVNAQSNEGKGELPYKTYSFIQYSGDKIWKDSSGSEVSGPNTEDIQYVTIRVQGFVNWDDDANDIISAEDKTKTQNAGTIDGNWDKPKYEFSDHTIQSDVNGDGVWDDYDKYFDKNENGIIDYPCEENNYYSENKRDSNGIVPPYQSFTVQVRSWYGAWAYSTGSLERYYYEFEVIDNPGKASASAEDAAGMSDKVVVYKLDPNTNKPIKHKIVYKLTELPVDGYESTKVPAGEFDATYIGMEGNEDDGTEYYEVDFLNVKEPVLDRSGEVVVTKQFDGSIFANPGSIANGTIQNSATTVFTLVGHLSDDASSKVVFNETKSANFTSSGEQTITFNELPIGCYYTLTEVAFDGQGYQPVNTETFWLNAEAGDEVADEPTSSPEGEEAGDESATDAETTGIEATEGEGTEGEAADESAEEPATPVVKATKHFTFTNMYSGNETPNQGFVNLYTNNGNGYDIVQINRTERLK